MPNMQLLRNVSRVAGFLLIASMGDSIAGEASSKLSYDRDVRPILSDNCFSCHGFDAESREADLRLDTADAVSAEGGVIVPGKPDESLLVERIESEDDDLLMPPPESGRQLSASQKDILKRWIEQGAHFETHWAFTPPSKPEMSEDIAVPHPIDKFIQARLMDEGIAPAPVANAETLIRRLSLDLIGLPPTVQEIDEFEKATLRDYDLAYSALVERLLASPHYGERWGRWWLDQARYADSHGYSIDGPREIWLFRDWVVSSLNADIPFDQFTVQQLAGDLLPDATDRERIATGFHRNTQINKEGGIDPEQFRIDSVFDRVGTTGTVWLGLTIGCAQCHDHKFDPISQREFYQLFAFFNNQDEPTLDFVPPEIDAAGLRRTQQTMVLKERDEPRTTNVFIKGDFTRPSDEVFPGTPSVLHSMDQGNEALNRLDLARWIVDRRNPLTARVIVNRVWQQYFGRGLVETENDFGLQGTFPSHPELLDWLAVEWMDRGWSLKELHRRIVTSHTYRQSSTARDELVDVDPLNILLARQNRLRLDAEIVRDVAISASGLFVPKLGGPPVFPPIPDSVMSQGQVKRQWKVSSGEDRYRRGLYTFVYRNTPPPSLSVFDAPEGLSSCTRRLRSNTPLQALTLMNDASFHECATTLKEMVEREGIATAFRRCTSRTPMQDELAVLEGLDSLGIARALLNLDETITRE